MPANDSASRPVTSALITLRSRNIGRRIVKLLQIANASAARIGSATAVSTGLIKNSTTRGDGRCQQSADELDQPGSEKDADTLDIIHHAGGERAGAVRVVIGDGQADDVRMDLGAQFRDEALRGLRKRLRQDKRRDALNAGRNHDGADERQQQIRPGACR